MDSFNAYAQRARDYASKAAATVSNPDAQKWFLMSVAIPAALFIILSPGLLLNLPPNSRANCRAQVPLPLSTVGVCTNGVFVPGTGDVAAGRTAAELLPVCKKQKECGSVAASGYTGYGAIVLHAFVFVLLAVGVNMALRRGGIESS